MIEITVKTLDSQNHAFTVEDDMTVAQFKEKIASTVNIPADTQRIIYCGKVLQDSAKLGECDVNGKVVHLVQRAPPQLNQRPSERSSSASPPLRRGGFRGFDPGNAMYLGSMAFPSNLMESQGIVPPPPTHSLAASRLNVAGRMLRRAEAVIRLLENPTLRPNEQQQPEETQEEITPVFEARIIVPNNDRNEPIDEALVLSAVQDTLLNANAVPINPSASNDAPANAENVNAESSQSNDYTELPSQQFTSTPESVTPTRSSNENLAATSEANNENNTGSSLPENALPVSEMSELLTMLNQLQTRFAPFLERYQNFMQEDPVVASDNVRQTQSMINRVSEVLHFLGHAYHSLSDIIVRVRSPPPRPLLCRPILIQHSAVVQTGFPIQVEAQINFSSTTTSGTTNSTNTTTSAPSTTTTPSASETVTTTTAAPVISAQIQPTMVGLPFLPGSGMRVQSIPIEIRGLPRSNNISVSLHRPLNNNHIPNPNNSASQTVTTSSNGGNATATTTSTSNNQSGSNGSAQTTTSTTTTTTSSSERSETTFNMGGFNNPNLEFFMEVTPESITIDSLETTLVGSNQAGDLLRGALNGPPPELLQSIVQMAGQIMNRHTAHPPPATTTSTTSEPSAPPTETTNTQINVSANQATSGQNSQARGNTQTNPTTATHTRSTSRPHVHLAQHAMQGFDPFLPCNSHHVTPRRRLFTQNVNVANGPFGLVATSTPISSPQRGQSETSNSTISSLSSGDQQSQLNPLYSVMQGIISSLHNVYGRGSSSQPTQSAPAQTASNAPSSNNENNLNVPNSSPLPPFSTFLPHLQNMNLSDFNRDGPTIAQLLQQLPDESYVEGESIFTDLIMLLSQNLTLGDILQLNAGRLEPLNRIRNELRNFFMSRILDNTISPSSVERGVNRLMGELQPILDNLASLQVCDDIDVVRSVQMLFRARLPNIINLAASRSPNSLRMLVEQCRITTRQLCALTLRASANGQQGVEEVFNHIVTRYMQGIPNDIQHWTLLTSRVQLRQFMSTLSVPESVLQPYIVRKRDAVLPSVLNEVQSAPGDSNKSVEAMDLDEQEASGSATELGTANLNLTEDTEPLPNVVIGSENWHSQVPADWVPIIARDNQRQRRQNSQPPFSDAYLSGMPSKRRKIVASSKPQGSLPQVISESVRRAVSTTGLSSVAPLETVAQAAGADLSVQAAYRELLRTSVQSNIQNNEDFTPDRYPNASNYFNKQQ